MLVEADCTGGAVNGKDVVEKHVPTNDEGERQPRPDERSAGNWLWQVTAQGRNVHVYIKCRVLVALAKSDQPAYTVALVQQAIDCYDANGRQASIDHHNSPDSVDGRWYVFLCDENNVRIAHPTVKSLLGKPVDGPTGVDINGYAYGKDMVKTTEDSQWVSYVFLNPSTGREEVKHTWLKKRDGLIFGSGWYQVLPGFTE